ncbi:hypothetical protein GOODEAATRI_023145 [Goodea atripinnis]|uniref:Uncharacterized protein n=1 Tax=Goodea atripinnis TaxID=208336 RepID=A0ABV0Q0E5_9TELE
MKDVLCDCTSFVKSLLVSSSDYQDKLKRMELELEEEKSSVEMLTDRVSRSRDQIDQLRSELMQERSSKQDLELDKNAMERHVCQPAFKSHRMLQLALRVKALKRQVDEGETELERIETLRRKAQRDMEEQMELKDALQAKVTALETDLK